MDTTFLIALVVLAAVTVILLAVLLLRPRGDVALREKLDALRGDSQRLDQTLRDEQRAGRKELAESFEQFRGHVQAQLDSVSAQQRQRIDEFSTRLAQLIERTDRGGPLMMKILIGSRHQLSPSSCASRPLTEWRA